MLLLNQGPPGPQGDRGQQGPRGPMVSQDLSLVSWFCGILQYAWLKKKRVLIGRVYQEKQVYRDFLDLAERR